MAVFANEGMLQPYAPKGLDKIPPQYRDSQNPPRWVGMDVYGAAICFNTVEAQKQNLPKPTSWKDLTKPVYKGKIVMPNPASSGTGFFDVTAWLQLWGEADGWKYMDALHENIAQYTHSGSKPCVQAGSGSAYPSGGCISIGQPACPMASSNERCARKSFAVAIRSPISRRDSRLPGR
jgi:iron(III) transport system substrate-binding protein